MANTPGVSEGQLYTVCLPGSFSPRPINHTQTGLETKHSTISHGHPFPLLLHLMHKIFLW